MSGRWVGRRVSPGEQREADRAFLTGVARAFAGALFFSLPLLMTMEMWWLGFYLDRLRVVLLMVLMLPLLVLLNHYSGFREDTTWEDDAVDAVVAYGVGLAASFVVLLLFNVVRPGLAAHELVGMVALQSVPASFGAALARSVLGERPSGTDARRRDNAPYAAEIFFMLAGALFLAFNVAPTEEMVLLAAMMTPWHAVALALVSIALTHAVVYAVDFRGEHAIDEGTPGWSIFLRFTLVGYAVTLAVCAYVLWTFGRLEGDALHTRVAMTVVLAFPGALGAAGARLIL